MTKITVRGWYKDIAEVEAEVEAEELIVHFMDEEHFFLELRLKNGQTIQTMPIKGSV